MWRMTHTIMPSRKEGLVMELQTTWVFPTEGVVTSSKYNPFHLLVLPIIFEENLSWSTQKSPTNLIITGIWAIRELKKIRLKENEGTNNTSWRIKSSLTCTLPTNFIEIRVWFGKKTLVFEIGLRVTKQSLEKKTCSVAHKSIIQTCEFEVDNVKNSTCNMISSKFGLFSLVGSCSIKFSLVQIKLKHITKSLALLISERR